MPTVPFHYVDLRAFAYATEDEKRVADALRTFLPDDAEIDRVENVGHHGDRIVVLSARIENADGMRHVLDALADLDDVERVIDELDDRVDDDCALFLRVDKQAAFRGEV
ncbi:RNA-binding protein, partial [Halorubrum pallidum]